VEDLPRGHADTRSAAISSSDPQSRSCATSPRGRGDPRGPRRGPRGLVNGGDQVQVAVAVKVHDHDHDHDHDAVKVNVNDVRALCDGKLAT
jgi:hypothetical protein